MQKPSMIFMAKHYNYRKQAYLPRVGNFIVARGVAFVESEWCSCRQERIMNCAGGKGQCALPARLLECYESIRQRTGQKYLFSPSNGEMPIIAVLLLVSSGMVS